jgi:ADP-ribose pyrophosphatase YjhB (NUDIX family)
MPAETKMVMCVDRHGNQIQVPADQLTFRPSVYGIILQHNAVLLSKVWDGYDFPGGGLEIEEDLREGLKREVKEETGLEVRPGPVVACENSFFKLPYTERLVHTILMFFLCEVRGGSISKEFLCEQERLYAQAPEWVELSSLRDIKFCNTVDSPRIIEHAAQMLVHFPFV